jgi:hypothetical protein
MFEELVRLSGELGSLLDRIESEARREMYSGEGKGVHHRQLMTVMERARIAKAAISDQLSVLAREVRAAEISKVR